MKRHRNDFRRHLHFEALEQRIVLSASFPIPAEQIVGEGPGLYSIFQQPILLDPTSVPGQQFAFPDGVVERCVADYWPAASPNSQVSQSHSQYADTSPRSDLLPLVSDLRQARASQGGGDKSLASL